MSGLLVRDGCGRDPHGPESCSTLMEDRSQTASGRADQLLVSPSVSAPITHRQGIKAIGDVSGGRRRESSVEAKWLKCGHS